MPVATYFHQRVFKEVQDISNHTMLQTIVLLFRQDCKYMLLFTAA